MKKAIKILVSVLLAVAILASVCWYLFEYDPGFTRDLLLQQARKYEQQGRNSIAVWLYNLAYRQADQDDTVAIELAEYYKSIGNYTKAEYTLSKAIEDGGGAELYIALCKTFVEQDKLRDAVTMLDKVSDPNIRATLDAIRPAAPVPSHTPGHYSQYISISFSSVHNNIYVSTDKDYPSVDSDLLTENVTLSGGDTTFYVVAVGENGLVSPMGEYHYSVGGVIEEVIFADTAFEAAVRELLGLTSDEVVYSNTLWDVKDFTVPAAAVTCEDLHWLPNLTVITMEGCAFDDMQILETLTDLETVIIKNSVISVKNLSVIAQLPNLQKLTLSGCFLSTITNLAQAENLTYLDLSNNSIRDISSLSGMTQLTYLDMSENALVSMEALSGLTSLQTLDVSYNALVSTAPVASLVKLTYLDVSAQGATGLMKLEGIDALVNLTYFAASSNNLIDVDILAGCTQLKTLIISKNTILNLDVLAAHTQLEYLDFSYNEVSTLPVFSTDCPISIINGGYNQLTSLDRLAGLKQLTHIYMDYNKGIKNIDKLTGCPALKVVNVYGSAVTSVYKLTSKGITVNYTPK